MQGGFCPEINKKGGNDPEDVKKTCEEFGLVPLSAHVPYLDLIEDPEGTVACYKKAGCQQIVIPYLTEEYRPGAEKFEETIADMTKLGEIANKYGMTLLYHNHDFEFVKVDGEYGLDIIYNRIPANLLQTEVDTCWVNIGGENPAEYVKKYTGRAPVVHLKDFYLSGKRPDRLYALIGLDEDEEQEEASTFEFRPVGHGMQDMPAILDAAVAAGAGWVVVEQDEPSMGLSRMESIKASREYLKSLGW